MANAAVALERRLAQALGTHIVTPAERKTVQQAFAVANSWADLPKDVQKLVKRIEKMPTKA